MKKNAIVIASILFVAGCASGPTNYSTRTGARYAAPTSDVVLNSNTEMTTRSPQGGMIPPSNLSLSAQQDPAMGAFRADVSGTGTSTTGMASSVLDGEPRADSSVRGGSNMARGWDPRANLPVERSPIPLNPALQADSSVRGGSPMVRQSDWYNQGPVEMNNGFNSGIKADSSIRGGSNAARNLSAPSQRSSAVVAGGNPPAMASGELNYTPTLPAEQSPFGQRAANWNASDDLLTDGVQSRALSSSSQPSIRTDDKNASMRKSESFSAPSESVADAPNRRELNRSKQIEKNMNGAQSLVGTQYPTPFLPADGDILQTPDSSPLSASQNSGSSLAVGGPGSTETGAASSPKLNSGVLVNDSDRGGHSPLKNNRAQGISSAATGESVANSDASTGITEEDRDLAREVKSTLIRETTGTSDVITQREVARDVHVTSHDGRVVLNGTVPDQKAKDLLEIRVREIIGVHHVDNQLRVATPSNSALRDLGPGRNLEDTTDQLHTVNPQP